MAVRAATADELLHLRTDGQWSKLYLAFPQPAIVFKARVNQATISRNMIIEITYDTVTVGAYTDILKDMTLLVGTTEGGHDRGIARIRKTCTDTKLYLGETSEVKFYDDAYLTVIDEYGIWARMKYVASGSSHIDFMDRDIAYTDQHKYLDPVPVLGPDRVLFYQGTLGGGNTISAYPDASDSYCLGSTITAYSWSAPGASNTSNMATATPTITYNSPGTYGISCQVTAANGKTFRGRRVVVVYDDTDPPVSDFQLTQCAGDFDAGGWQFRIDMYDNATLPVLRDRARVILFSRDWYGDITALTDTNISFNSSTNTIERPSGLDIFLTGMTIQVSGSSAHDGVYNVVTGGVPTAIVVDKPFTVSSSPGETVTIRVVNGSTEVSIGQVAGCGNIIASGWIAKEDLMLDVDGGVASFTAHGPHYWLGITPNLISGIFDIATDPVDWNYMLDLTVAKGVWDILHWKSTCTRMMDVIMLGCDQEAPTSESASIGAMWDQIKGMLHGDLLAVPCCDRYGRMYIEVDGQYVSIGSRAFTSVMTVEDYDREGEITLERQSTPSVSAVDLTGVYFTAHDGYGVRGLSPGNTLGRHGTINTIDKILVTSQAQCTELAGLILAQRNNLYPSMSFNLASNNKLVDICPQQQLAVSTDASQSPRGITVPNSIFIRNVTMSWISKDSYFTVGVTGEPEVTIVPNTVKGDVPEKPDDPETPETPTPWPPIPPLPLPNIPEFGYGYRTYTWVIEDPSVGILGGPYIARESIINTVRAHARGTGTVEFNLERRSTPDVAGTDMLAAELSADSDGVLLLANGLATGYLPVGSWLHVDISDVIGTNPELVICVEVIS